MVVATQSPGVNRGRNFPDGPLRRAVAKVSNKKPGTRNKHGGECMKKVIICGMLLGLLTCVGLAQSTSVSPNAVGASPNAVTSVSPNAVASPNAVTSAAPNAVASPKAAASPNAVGVSPNAVTSVSPNAVAGVNPNATTGVRPNAVAGVGPTARPGAAPMAVAPSMAIGPVMAAPGSRARVRTGRRMIEP